jgi:hypothetical protein
MGQFTFALGKPLNDNAFPGGKVTVPGSCNADDPLSPFTGRRKQTFTLAAPAFASGHFKELSLAGESGKRGAGSVPL